MDHPDKRTLVAMLDRWIRQRPGMDPCNYGDASSYRRESRSITRDGREARQLLQYVDWHGGISAASIAHAFKHAYSGRLSLEPCEPNKANGGMAWRLSYCTGQYWPTEYRRAVCAVLASVIWDYWRAGIPDNEDEERTFLTQQGATSAGDYLRRVCVRREFGASAVRTLGKRWFN